MPLVLTTNANKTISRCGMAVMSPRFRSYAQENMMCQGTTFAFTAHDGWQSITFCPLAFEFSRRKHSLSECRNGDRTITDGTSMQLALSTPAIFLHELIHIVNKAKHINFTYPNDGKYKTAYGAGLTGYLAIEVLNDSANNADNYILIATAMYLPQYDWPGLLRVNELREVLLVVQSRLPSWKHTIRRHVAYYLPDLEVAEDDGFL
ncbi:hypothetical protein PENFLA_c020G05708 [Penicillium flavigenum]|uniref:Lysine-specific metallo-endopeptidase domain-containing protein n=1 Tax=Penicillium flavigenum TaxID=254877 RepID=A0A1V6SZB1_9EURO|nr:hypothetical protein PENFLA_c020G05708 [Penicillium flavigenum]